MQSDGYSELVRDFLSVVARWPEEIKLAYLRGEIGLEQAMTQARLMGYIETVDRPAVQGLGRGT